MKAVCECVAWCTAIETPGYNLAYRPVAVNIVGGIRAVSLTYWEVTAVDPARIVRN